MPKDNSSRGGSRPGAGRKPGSGHYGEPTTPLRVPVSLAPAVRAWLKEGGPLPGSDGNAGAPLPFYASRVAAGQPAAYEEEQNEALDLNTHLVKRPEATFLIRAQGHSMEGAGIFDGDLLVVERAGEARDGCIVIAELQGEVTVKRLSLKTGEIRLLPENPAYSPIDVSEAMDFRILGVVAHAIHSL